MRLLKSCAFEKSDIVVFLSIRNKVKALIYRCTVLNRSVLAFHVCVGVLGGTGMFPMVPLYNKIFFILYYAAVFWEERVNLVYTVRQFFYCNFSIY